MSERILRSLQETEDFAQEFAVVLGPGDLVLLDGDLAAGKTTFVGALIRALGSSDEVASPTYALHHRYASLRAPFFIADHWDLYRLKSEAELEGTGFWDLLEGGDPVLTLIEWPGLVADSAWPRQRKIWRIQFFRQDEERKLLVTPDLEAGR